MTVEEKRRELFENWYFENRRYFAYKNLDGSYLQHQANVCWEGFNAALDAIEIELPAKNYTGWRDTYEVGRNCGISEVTSTIESLNLGIKIK